MQRILSRVSAYFVRGCFAVLAGIVAGAIFSGVARAEIFILANDGQVQGEELKVPGTPANQTVIRTASGGQLTLDKSQIKQIIPQGPAELEYERIRPTYADTVDDQWRLADWCRAHGLPKQRQVASRAGDRARSGSQGRAGALGYAQIEGRWVRPDDLKRQQGFVMYKGEWRLPQEVELLEENRKESQAEHDWVMKLKRWRVALDNHPEKSDALHDELMKIDDPAAVPALTQLLNNEKHRSVKILLIEELLHIGTPGAMNVVVGRTMDDADEEVRLSAMDRLVAANHPEVASFYVAALRSPDNARINQAALVLGNAARQIGHQPVDRRPAHDASARRAARHAGTNLDDVFQRPGQQPLRRNFGRRPGERDGRNAGEPASSQRPHGHHRRELPIRPTSLASLVRRPDARLNIDARRG